MKKIIKRVIVLFVCAALFMGDNALQVLADEVQTEVVEETSDVQTEAIEEVADASTEEEKTDSGIEADFDEEKLMAEDLNYTPYAGATYTLLYKINNTSNGKQITIVKAKGTIEGSLVIPSEIDGIKVTEIGDYAFSNCKKLVGQMAIPNSITTIGEYAFNFCEGLTGDLTIPDSVKTIKKGAFYCCKGFNGDLKLPNNLAEISDEAFYGCEGLTGKLVIPQSVKGIGAGAFMNCKKITGDLKFLQNITELGGSAFCCCESLTGDLIIPEGITEIGTYTFNDCVGLTGKLSIPDSVEKIGSGAFNYCTGLTGDLTIPDSVKNIGECAFRNCSGLKGKLTISNKISTIPNNAFEGCSGLTGELDLRNVEIIEDNAFTGCSGFTGDLDLSGISSYTGASSIGKEFFKDCKGFDGVLIISKNIKLKGNEFDGCSGIKAIENYAGLPLDLSRLTGSSTEKHTWKDYFTNITVTKAIPNSVVVRDDFDGKLEFATKSEGDFKYITYQGKEEKYDYVFDPAWFEVSDNKSYNQDIANISMRLTMSTLEADDINYFMDQMGFNRRSGSQNYEKPWVDTIGTTIGDIALNPNTSLILVAVRSGRYTTEWRGNFHVKEYAEYEKDHAGFKIAAEKINSRVEDYIKNNRGALKKNIKLWYVGYSRGAATANMAAAQAIDGGVSVVDSTGSNVYAYCFECPKNTRDKNANSSKYGCIWNIVNPVDFVPQVAMGNRGEWDFRRYGTTYVLPSVLSSYNYNTLMHTVKYNYADILSRYSGTSGSLAEKLSEFSPVQPVLISDILDILTGLVSSPEEFLELPAENLKYELFKHRLYLSPTGRYVNKTLLSNIRSNITWQFNFQDNAEKLMAQETWNDPDYEAAEVGNSIARAHYFELCLAWMDSYESSTGGSLDLGFLKSGKSYGTLLINCPIDVEVYDSNNTLVGKIVNDTPQNIENGIYTEFDENGQKVVYLPGDAEYHVVLKATDDGSVNVNFENIDLESYALTNLITYNDVQVEEGDELSLDVDISAEEEREVELRDSEDVVIEQSLNQKGDDIDCYDVNLEVVGDGSVDGFGNYPSGEFVTLRAYPEVYSTFRGWQKDGVIVTTDSEYRIQVTEEINLTAVFESGSNTLWIDGVEESYEYTGTAIKPEVKIYEGRELLVQGKDYTVTYKNNINAYTLTEGDEGFDPKKAPTVIITGKGNYSGPDTVTFKITKSNFSSEIFAADDINITATGKEQKPKPVLKWNGKNVPTNTYSYKYYKADEEGNPRGEFVASVKDAGKYVIVITANENSNFTGTRTVKLNLLDEQKLVSKLSIAAISQQNYTGSPIEPGVVVKEGKDVLTEGTDYTVEYKNNTAVGTATAVITGIGGYAGTKTLTFKINGVPLSKATVEGITSSVPYTGNDIEFDSIRLYIKATKTTGEKTLTDGTDYTVSYSKNQAAGTATVLFTGIGGYTGTVKKTFKITPYKATVDDTRISVSVPESVEYSKGGAKPAVTVKFTNSDGTERTLIEKTDYTLAYQKNTAVNDCSNAKNMPVVKVTLKGSYNGTISKNFKIEAKNISSVSMDVADKTYANKKNSYASAPTLTDTDGKKLAAGKDYEKVLTYRYKNNTTVVVNGTEEPRIAGTEVGKDDIIPAGTWITVTAKGIGNYEETISGDYRITQSSVTSAKVTVPAQEYTGKPITINEENMTVKVGKDTLTAYDFEIVEGSYQNNTNKGTASFIIRGKGNYGGTKKVTFSIKTKVFKWWWR